MSSFLNDCPKNFDGTSDRILAVSPIDTHTKTVVYRSWS